MELDNLRREYKKGSLNDSDVKANPFDQFKLWMNEALRFIPDDPTAMILTTVSSEGKPSSRIVLLKEYANDGFSFFTNYESRKGQELSINENASILFYWKELERQIRIEGKVLKTDLLTSENYFDSRPLESRIAAIVSNQSKVILNREDLDDNFNKLKNSHEAMNITWPEYWGGYMLHPNYFEFWQGRENRMHDRISYVLENDLWEIKRLAP